MGIKQIFIITYLLSLSYSHAQENSPTVDVDDSRAQYSITTKYRGGHYLIYDCKGSYYTCVNKDSYELCESERTKSKSLSEKIYRCAPLRMFKNKEECLQKNYQIIERVTLKKFCFPQ